jgi:hypothetical protein
MSSAEMNQKKLNLIAWINELSDVDLIALLDGLRQTKSEGDWWNEISADQKKLIKRGLDDVEHERVMSSAEFWKR